MPYQFTANLAIQNADRLDLANVSPQRSVRSDPTSIVEVHVDLELRAGNSGNTPLAEYGSYTVIVRDGMSDLLRLRTVAEWVPRSPVSERLIVVRGGRSTPTGIGTFLAAFGSGSTNNQLNAALTALKTLGIIDQATLAGSAP